ncbi:MAG: acyltransferase [Microbacteriaceae bacterium]|nr:MAG: acyltransferase [Microbacteriaceae bacterium]
MGRLRAAAKRLTPGPIRELVRWYRDVWGDLRLRLLTDIGYFPSHAVRRFFYRRAGLKIDGTSSLHWRAGFYAPENIVIGRFCTIGDTSFLDGRSGLTIGDRVNLGSHVSIYTRQHEVDSRDFAEIGAPVTIGNYAWVSSHSIVLPGVTIGDGAVIAAGAVVTKDVAPYTLVGGNPARYIRDRSHDLDYKLGYAKRFV